MRFSDALCLFSSSKSCPCQALVTAEKKSKPHRDELFTDVYDTIPKHLQRQKQELEEHLAKYPDQYDLNAH